MSILFCCLLMAAIALACPRAANAGTGGGYTAAGLHGDYFGNTTWNGAPAFSRQDDRVDFTDAAPANHLPPGGSFSTGFNAVGAANWSARWTGQVIPRFSEPYTFKVYARGSCQLKINGTAVIDQATFTGAASTGTYTMVAGTRYDIAIAYSHTSGDWAMTVHWSSPSTPDEVIDPLSVTGVHVFYYMNQAWANQIFSATACNGPKGEPIQKDADGWPMTDGRFQLMEGDDDPSLGNGTYRNSGTYHLQFTGRAEVTSYFGGFTCNGKKYGNVLPFAIGWDPKTNITSADLVYGKGVAHLEWITFRQTRRGPADTTSTGVTNVKLMAPTELGGATPYDPGIFFQPLYKQNLSRYTTLRRPHNEYYEPDYAKYDWSDRNPGQSCLQDAHTSYEWLILLSNETGKDCYLQLPVEVGDDYVKKCALIFRYGSDGLNPYDPNHDRDSLGNDLYHPIPDAGPTYPPLNSNLRLYIELGNEVWDAYGGDGPGYNGAATYCRKAAMNAIPGQDHAADHAIVNYDGHASMRRWHLLRTKQVSDIFRTVFPEEMPDGTARIRPIWEWQYEWTATFEGMLTFLDNYFNNGDGMHHVATPHPINYFIWGGGGAVYFGPANPDGTQSAITFANPSFEQNVIPAGTTSTTVASWTATGDAGIYHNNTGVPIVSDQTLGTLKPGAAKEVAAFGFKFTVGKSDLIVSDLGRWVTAGDSKARTVSIVRADNGQMMCYTSVLTAGLKPGQYSYGKLSPPKVLTANTSYLIVSGEETESGKPDPYYDQDTTITAKDGITVDGAVSATRTKRWWFWTATPGTAGNHGYGPVDFKFVPAPVGDLGYVLDAPAGEQAAYIGGTGTLSQTVNFTKTGHYALKFAAAGKPDHCNGLRMSITDSAGHTTNITPLGQSDWRTSDHAYLINQGWSHDYRWFGFNGSAVFDITQPGAYTLTFAGTTAGKYVYLDEVTVVSVEAMFVGGLGGGSAMGQPAISDYAKLLNVEADWCLVYGLKEVAYEAGWSAGGDFAQLPFQNWAKYCDPHARDSQIDSINLFTQAGSTLYICGSYPQWPQGYDTFYADASKFMLPQGVDIENDRLPAPPTNGLAIPAVLTPKNSTLVENAKTSGAINAAGGWIDWNVIANTSATYTFTAKASGGSTVLIVDGAAPIASGASVKLTAGLHSVRIKSTDGAAAISEIEVTNDAGQTAPAKPK